MKEERSARNIWALFVPILLAIAYRSWFYFQPRLTGSDPLDGLLGVMLSLYICARSAANLLDMLFYSRSAHSHNKSMWSNELWFALNSLTLIIGLMLIIFALTRFFR
jgi:hypothetical protein